MNPAAKDRMMQVHLAQARGSAKNGELLKQSIYMMLRMDRGDGSIPENKPVDNALMETLRGVTAVLEDLGVPHAVTGSIASSVYGEPFMSQDVDLVVAASPTGAVDIARRLTPRFYAPEDMLRDAAVRHAFANVVDNRTGLKADLSFVEPLTFPGTALARRQRVRIGVSGPEFWFVTPEDVILMKLVWRKDTQSAKQWENALSVARMKGARMDWKYLWEQAAQLGITDDLTTLRNEAGI